jgi:hypothetical protein
VWYGAVWQAWLLMDKSFAITFGEYMTLDSLHQAMVDALRNAPVPQCFYRGKKQDIDSQTIAICASVCVWDALVEKSLIDPASCAASIFGYLIYANDSARMSFEEIAVAIEKHELFYNMGYADGAAFQAHHPSFRLVNPTPVNETFTPVT